jgi:hypothetical protein
VSQKQKVAEFAVAWGETGWYHPAFLPDLWETADMKVTTSAYQFFFFVWWDI